MGETPFECAVREVKEEAGFDISEHVIDKQPLAGDRVPVRLTITVSSNDISLVRIL